jgi:hypothetical protein
MEPFYFETLDEEEKESLVVFARREVKKAVNFDESNFTAVLLARAVRANGSGAGIGPWACGQGSRRGRALLRRSRRALEQDGETNVAQGLG